MVSQERKNYSKAISLCVFSTIVGIAIWCWILFFSGELKILEELSGKLVVLGTWKTGRSVIMLIGSLFALCTFSYLLVAKKRVFICLAVSAFGLSEVIMPWLNTIAFTIRYVSIVILICIGIMGLRGIILRGADVIELFGITYLIWIVINFIVNGASPGSLAMLPIQFGLFLGIIIGLRSIITNNSDVKDLYTVLGCLGVAFTVFHFLAFWLADEPMLAGRFRSVYPLPTNFANGYALLLISMLWLALEEDRMWLRTGLLLLSGVGVIMIILSGTRNSVFMVILSFAVLTLVGKYRISLLVILILTILGIIISVAFLELEIFNSASERLARFNLQNRIELWRISWNFISERPILGYGMGNVLDVMRRSMPKWTVLNTHNAYLGIWMQLGIVGLAGILGIYFVCFLRGLKMLLSSRVPMPIKRVLVLPVIILFVLFLSGFFEENLTSRGSLQQILWGLAVLGICNTKIISNGMNRDSL